MLALFYQFDDTASTFASSSQDLNAIWELCKYTLKATPFLGLYVDGSRERMPYEADAYIQQLGHYAVDREYAIARYTAENLFYHATWPTEWFLHSILMAWADYPYTGNTELLFRSYDTLKAKALLALARDDGLISTRTGLVTPAVMASIRFTGRNLTDIVDWPHGTQPGQPPQGGFGPAGETDDYVFTPGTEAVLSLTELVQQQAPAPGAGGLGLMVPGSTTLDIAGAGAHAPANGGVKLDVGAALPSPPGKPGTQAHTPPGNGGGGFSLTIHDAEVPVKKGSAREAALKLARAYSTR